MKKLIGIVLLVLLAAVPIAATASDIHDGQDCRDGNGQLYEMGSTETRAAYCVNYYGVTVLYVGGNAQDADGEPCGAVIVAGATIAGEDDWDNNGTDGKPGTTDDEHCN